MVETMSSKASVGPDHPTTIGARAIRAFTLGELGDHRAALAEQTWVVDAYARHPAYGPEHPETIRARANRAFTLGDLGDLEQALEEETWVVDARAAHSSFGPDHPNTIQARSNRAFTLGELGRHTEALVEQELIVAARSADPAIGPDHPDTIRARANRASTLWALGRQQEALAEYTWVLDARLADPEIGPNHVDTIRARANRASILSELGEHQQALKERSEVLEIRCRHPAFGTDHPETIIARSNRASTLADLGDHRQALAEQQLVVDLYGTHSSFGPDHPYTLLARASLALTLWALREYRRALEEQDAILEAYERHPSLGLDHPDAIRVRVNRALTLDALADHERALAELTWVVEAYAAHPAYGPSHPYTIRARAGRASTLQAMGNYSRALAEQRAVVAAARTHSSLGDLNPLTARFRVKLGELIGETDAATGLMEVLAGMAILDRSRYKLAASRYRDTWMREHSTAVAAALDLAVSARDPRLVLEIVEAARTQALPTGESSPDGTGELIAADLELDGPGSDRDLEQREPEPYEPPALRAADSAAAAAMGDEPSDWLEMPPFVTVDGRSALAAAMPLAPPNGPTAPEMTSLELIATALVPQGNPIVWWGSWITRNRIYHAVAWRDGGEEWTYEAAPPTNFAAGSAARSSVAAWSDALGRALYSVDNEVRSPLEEPDEEHRLLAQLAETVLPDSIRKRLALGGSPPWLVIAPAPQLAALPLTMLPLHSAQGPSGPRLIDRAIPIYSPSVGFQWGIQQRIRKTSSAPDGHVAVSIANPTHAGEPPLEFACPLPRAKIVLERDAATKERVFDALSRAERGIVHIAAHAHAPTERPGDTAILLSGTDKLSARELLARSVRTPLALLSCCGTAATQGERGPFSEWLGLGPAFLWAGAEAVIATLWPIRDTPQATQLEAQLAARSRRGEQPAVALRNLQRELLQRWRSHKERDSLGPVDFTAYITLRAPVP